MSEELAALEARSDQPVDPEFTIEHKAGILLCQRHILSLQINGNRARKQLEDLIARIDAETRKAADDLGKYLDQVGKELNIDHSLYTYDLDNLKPVRRPQLAAGNPQA